MNATIINLFLAFLFLSSCANDSERKATADLVRNPLTAARNTEEVLMPKIEIDKDFFDFGKMSQNESVSTEFRLKNIGEAPLLIRSAKGSCGCTVPEWPSEAIESGDVAIIKVTFNSGNRKGKQNKMVTLVTNTIPSTKVLTIIGTVLVPKNK